MCIGVLSNMFVWQVANLLRPPPAPGLLRPTLSELSSRAEFLPQALLKQSAELC
jgi:hypothetical protein